MEENEMVLRTKNFAYNCLDISEYIHPTYLGNHVRGQLVRSATSGASNYRAARLSQSKAAFVSKLSISIEEIDESVFWMQVIIDKSLIKEQKRIDSVLVHIAEGKELTSILIKTRLTVRNKYLNPKTKNT